MKILYAIQGTGNGHISRARDIINVLKMKGELDLLVSGTQSDITIDYPIKYKFSGLSFFFGHKGGVDLPKTFYKTNAFRLNKEISSVPVEEYDLVINDFEPISAWACRLKGIPCIGLSHQSAILSPNAPKPANFNYVGDFIYKNYAPVSKLYGFHYRKFDKNIFTPVIRKQIREAKISDQGHYTVYLPSYGDAELYNFLSTFQNIKWEVFSKHNRSPFKLGNVHIRPLNNDAFVKSITSSTGVLCGAGFETPAEALFLNKKLLVIPMKNQYEQQCNAETLKMMGVSVLNKLDERSIYPVAEWLENDNAIHVNYPDITENIIDLIIDSHFAATPANTYPIDYAWEEQQYEVSRISPV